MAFTKNFNIINLYDFNPLIIGVCTLPDTVWISDEVITCIAKVW